MVESGAWCKVSRQHYRHVSGAEIRYDCNRWVWQIVGGDAYTLLWVARHVVERSATPEAADAVARTDSRVTG